MAGNKRKIMKGLQESLTLTVEPQKFLSYADCVYRTPVFSSLLLTNASEEDAEEITVALSSEENIVLETKKTFELVPYGGNVEVVFEGVFSPVYFIEKKDISKVKFNIRVEKDKEVLLSETAESTVLPFDWWCGLEGNAENVASFVRPKIADCDKVLSEAAEQLKKWELDSEIDGYSLADKNKVRNLAAAIFMSVKRIYISKSEETDLTNPTLAGCVDLIKEKKANALQVACFTAACLERAKLHPVILLGKNNVACGVWLYDSCFLDSVSDDMALVGKYASDGINNLSVFDIEDLFDNKSVAYSVAETHFKQKLSGELYENVVDIRRCRLDNVFALPLRAQGLRGYEVLDESEMSSDAPRSLPQMMKLSLEEGQTKNRQWERKLLDLSLKNTLLNFDVRKALHVVSADADSAYAALSGGEKLLYSVEEGKSSFGNVSFYGASEEVRAKRELIALENENGICRVFSEKKDVTEIAGRFVRLAKAASEESGTRVLYCAFGFLKWYAKEDGKEKFAPLILQPIEIKKLRGENNAYVVSVIDEEFSVNATLLEYLKQEFDVDIRGLGGNVSSLKISEIIAMVKMEIVSKKGWDVFDDVYLATFSFARYLMWNDVRKNIDTFRKNPLISSLLDNRNELNQITTEEIGEDGLSPLQTLTPLVADSSQFGAISLSQQSRTFVLHGPPGTGKSQTITNMIANALNDGKRVLFVAEKQAALNVVKKRLDGIGIGDFCLELHSGKTNKAEIIRKIENTLSLAQRTVETGEGENREDAEEKKAFWHNSDSIEEMRALIQNPLSALHKKRRLGVSVYGAILLYLKNKNAPDIMNIESTFYDGLTEEKLHEYERLLVRISAAAKECGGVYNSPFSDVGCSEYSQAVRDGVYCASEVMLTEIKHLKNYLGLVLELYRQRISVFTRRKISLLRELVAILSQGELNKFFTQDEQEFFAFFNANKRLDACLNTYYKTFRTLIDIKKEYPAMGQLLENPSDNYASSKVLSDVMKKLSRAAIEPLNEKNAWKYLQNIYEIQAAMERVGKNTNLSKNFINLFGGFDFKKREDFLKQLYHMHDICAELFMDYNADSFNSMCHRAACGYTKPALDGLVWAIDCFERAETGFCAAIECKKMETTDDLLDHYTAKAGALIDNIDMLASWCNYRATAKKLDENGLRFITDAMESGYINGENISAAFKKNVYKNFLDINIPADPVLSKFSAAVLEETVEQFRITCEKFNDQSKSIIRKTLISRLPEPNTDGSLSMELGIMNRLLKSKLRGMGVRSMMEETPSLMRVVAPCMLMSPLTVSQYLQPTVDFDLVIFDEASQLPTSEAIGALARAKNAIIVGDPKQLPPTSFFSAVYTDEENPESEDMESILDDCLALGIPERYLLWHYRSKHESLIAFSNNMYYDGKLCTFPSPDELESKVTLHLVEDAFYDRGGTKRNEKEAEELIKEVIRRLKDPVLSRSSIGIVTFSTVQKDLIERRLNRAISENNLEEVAFDREEPLFVKNLENVQGDERDVILFSVCYGPDRMGRVSLNFGPLNQLGGWRRLNVAVSRAREEMLVFSSMTSNYIDLSKTKSKGVAGLKAFLEFAQKGRTSLAVNSSQTQDKESIGKYVAQELTALGYDCRRDVGASNFKIDVAIVDPKNKSKFILGIIMDASTKSSVKDRNVLQIRTLKRSNWNILRLYTVNYFNNPKREIKKIKDQLDRLTGADKRGGTCLIRAKKVYKEAVLQQLTENAAYVSDPANGEEIISRLKKIVAAEEPISRNFLIKRCLSSLGIVKYGGRTEEKLSQYIAACAFKTSKMLHEEYFYKTEKAISFEKYRVEESVPLRKSAEDFTPYEIMSIIRAALEDKVALYVDELTDIVSVTFRLGKPSDRFVSLINNCIAEGEKEGLFIRSVSDRITLA